jgi:hypothetical protein
LFPYESGLWNISFKGIGIQEGLNEATSLLEKGFK